MVLQLKFRKRMSFFFINYRKVYSIFTEELIDQDYDQLCPETKTKINADLTDFLNQ